MADKTTPARTRKTRKLTPAEIEHSAKLYTLARDAESYAAAQKRNARDRLMRALDEANAVSLAVGDYAIRKHQTEKTVTDMKKVNELLGEDMSLVQSKQDVTQIQVTVNRMDELQKAAGELAGANGGTSEPES